jgi:hypothetical protein
LRVQATKSLSGFEVTTDGTGVVGHAGAALLRELADRVGLTRALGWGASRGRRRRHPDAAVLRNLAVRRLRDQRNVALDASAEQHLGRRAPEALRDPCRCFAAEVATVSERTVSLENHPVATTRVKEPLPILVRTELHLVDDRRDARRCEQLLEFGDVEVGTPIERA